MKKIHVALKQNPYSIYFSKGEALKLAGLLSKQFPGQSRWALVSNPVLKKLYGSWLEKELADLGKFEWFLVPEGEKYKTLKSAVGLYDQLAEQKIDRKTPLIALGGGVIGDLAGFVSATYLRGIPFVQIPTTLLAQVDSSVGGKTGVDLVSGKNLVGAFYQPRLVYIDLTKLKTLSKRELLCGSAEVIKYGAIQSKTLFEVLEKRHADFLNLDFSLVEKVVMECVQIKADIVEKDEKETKGLRALLNFGHTLGHAVETLSGYKKYNHGEAIAIGMGFAADFSAQLGLLKPVETRRLKSLIQNFGLPLALPKYSAADYCEVMSRDKKMKAGKIQYVLLKQLGKACLKELSLESVQDFLNHQEIE